MIETTNDDQPKKLREMIVTCPTFLSDDYIPSKYTCDGENISPPLHIEQIPKDAKCFALIVDDIDAPGGSFVHWLSWNIPIKHTLHENQVHGNEGRNDAGQQGYFGPCPPKGIHRYYFKIYALDDFLQLPPETNKEQLVKAMEEYTIAYGELIGHYERQ